MDRINKSTSTASSELSQDEDIDKENINYLGKKVSVATAEDPIISTSHSCKSNFETPKKKIDDFLINSLNSDDSGRFSLTDDLGFVKELGRGGNGSVWLVDSDDGGEYAFKLPFNSECLSEELEKMEKVGQHPNLIKSFGLAEISDKKGILMEYIPGEDLSKILPKITEHYLQDKLSHSDFWGTIQFILKETLSGIRHLELKGYAHQDIKPQNIRIHEERLVPVIFDFGNLAEFGQTGKIGTELYSTPETFSSREKGRLKAKVSDKLDAYSIGQITYSILSKIVNPSEESFFTAGVDYKNIASSERMALLYKLRSAMTEYQKVEDFGDYKKALNPISQNKLDSVVQANLSSALKKSYEKKENADVPLDVMIERVYPESLREAMTGYYRDGYESSLVKFINSALHPNPSLRINAEDALKQDFITDPLIEDESAKRIISGFFG